MSWPGESVHNACMIKKAGTGKLGRLTNLAWPWPGRRGVALATASRRLPTRQGTGHSLIPTSSEVALQEASRKELVGIAKP